MRDFISWVALIAASGCGQINGYSVAGTSAQLEYVYIGNFGSSTISTYQLTNGTLSLAANTLPTGSGTANVSGLAVGLSGLFLFAVNQTTSNLTEYAIAPESAEFPATPTTVKAAALVPTGSGASAIAIDPLSKHAYVSDSTAGGSNISAYDIDPTTGVLSAIAGAAARVTPIALAVDLSGDYLYVANQGTSNLSEFAIASDGTLSTLATVTIGQTGPTALALSPGGKFLYVANGSSNSVSGFSIGAGGALTALSPAPTATTGAAPSALAMNSAGTFLFTANQIDGTISVFAVDPTAGTLTEELGSPYPLGGPTSPAALAVDPSGTYLISANSGSGNVSVLLIDPLTGALTVVGAPTATGTNPSSLAFVGFTQPQ